MLLKSTDIRDELSITMYLQYWLKNKQLKLKDPAKGVFSIMHGYLETHWWHLLFTKYLTSTNNYANCSAEKRAQK